MIGPNLIICFASVRNFFSSWNRKTVLIGKLYLTHCQMGERDFVQEDPLIFLPSIPLVN